ncbi:MAG: cytidine deaminase [Verrucomicrobia bacterium]|nr:cytidine deaminase [Verrucomicrobiota bacterium]
MRDSSITIILPQVAIADSIIESPAGRIIVPGHHLPEKRVNIDAALAQQLLTAARATAANAHAPYSNFHVGAAVVMADDPERRIITGANVENGSYGATICAERSALAAASSLGFRALRYLALSTADSLTSPLCDRSPCGICRQTIREFIARSSDASEALILVDTAEPGTLCEAFDIDRLLPYGFNFAPPGIDRSYERVLTS